MSDEKKKLTLKEYLEARTDALATVVPKHLSVDRMIKVALSSVSKNEKLQQCSMVSILQCVITCAELGLEPGGALGGAYLVPYWSKKDRAFVCTFQFGYRGMVDLMRRSGLLSTIRAVAVHEKDRFTYKEGLTTVLEHEPYLDGPAGDLRYVYCVITLRDGGQQVEVMSRAEVDAIRQRSQTPDSGPWASDFEAMAKKTVIRRAAKLAPMSPELARGLEAEDEVIEGQVTGRDIVKNALAAGMKAPPLPQESIPALDAGSTEAIEEPQQPQPEEAPAPRATPTAPRATPPAAPVSSLDELLAGIAAVTEATGLNAWAGRISKLEGPAKQEAMAAYAAKAKALRGGGR